jgi:uncharacterized radical SAM superfamily Fe-S cluster-containing enzyme
MVSNGIRLAREPDFAEKLVAWGFTSVYLQFDSTRPADIVKLRGLDQSQDADAFCEAVYG